MTPSPNTQSKEVELDEEIKMKIHMLALSKSENAKDVGDCTVIRMGYITKAIQDILANLLTLTRTQCQKEMVVTGETSDGYHTFNELYEFRKLYNACLFNEWYSRGMYDVHKSKRHHDGEECFGGGWFIVTAQLPSGQISNHYELKDWDLFRCVAYDTAKEWDGHSAQDVSERLLSLLKETSGI
jgi:hypothetical protein